MEEKHILRTSLEGRQLEEEMIEGMERMFEAKAMDEGILSSTAPDIPLTTQPDTTPT